jgi:hypothetical protein
MNLQHKQTAYQRQAQREMLILDVFRNTFFDNKFFSNELSIRTRILNEKQAGLAVVLSTLMTLDGKG